MDFLRLFRRKRSGDRRGVPPVVEAARRAQRARAHLDSKRSKLRGGNRAPGLGQGRGEPLAPEIELDFAAPFERPFEPPLGRSIEKASEKAIEKPAERPNARPIERPGAPARAVARSSAGTAPVARPLFAQPPAPSAQLKPQPPPRAGKARSAPPRALVPSRPLPRFVAPGMTLLALGAGYAAGQPLFERYWLPRARLERVAVLGASVREPTRIARALLTDSGSPLDRISEEQIEARVLADPWIASARSQRLPDGTLLVGVVERQAVARYQSDPDSAVALVDPDGHTFAGAVEAGGLLPRVEGPLERAAATAATASDAEDRTSAAQRADEPGETRAAEIVSGTASAAADTPTLSATALEILGELQRHPELVADPSALTLHLPGSVRAVGDPIAAVDGADETADEAGAADTGYVLELGRDGPRALLGRSFLKRRIARLAALLDEASGNPLVAAARIIDLRYADRAVLRTEPTSG